MSDINLYLSGARLYGDDFGLEEIRLWFEDEQEGYANLGARDLDETAYEYHALNVFHGFRHLPAGKRFDHVLQKPGDGGATALGRGAPAPAKASIRRPNRP